MTFNIVVIIFTLHPLGSFTQFNGNSLKNRCSSHSCSGSRFIHNKLIDSRSVSGSCLLFFLPLVVPWILTSLAIVLHHLLITSTLHLAGQQNMIFFIVGKTLFTPPVFLWHLFKCSIY